MGYGKIKEWELNDKITTELINMLKEYKVEILRTDDPTGRTDVALSVRAKKANDFKADIFISNHHNAGIGGKSGGGLSLYRYTGSKTFTKKMQKDLYKSILAETGLKGNRVSPLLESTNLVVLKQTKMPAVLIEHGFMDSPTDMKIITQKDFAKKSATGILNWLVKHYKLEKKINYPSKNITPNSSREDVKWAQKRLNALLPSWYPRLVVDGIYGRKTRIAVLIYWDMLNWGAHMKHDGTGIGLATRKALAQGRKR